MKLLLSLAFLFFMFPLNVSEGKIKKGFRALDIYNYFEAKQLFEKSLKKQTAPAAYGLSIIYHRQDNPFFNLDSAYNHIVLAYNHYPLLKPREKEKYGLLGVDSVAIVRQREIISTQLF